MIDGYVEDVDFLRNLNWKEWEKEGYLPRRWYWYRLYRNLRADKPHDESDCISAFLISVNGFRDRYCPLDREEILKMCKLRGYTYSWYLKKARSRLLEKMPFLEEEVEQDKLKGRERYIQIRIIHKDNPDCNYQKLLKCCNNWIDKLGLKIKPKEYYKNYGEFETFWMTEMKQLMLY